MSRPKEFRNETAIPDEQIAMLAAALLPSVMEFWKSEHSAEQDSVEAVTVSENISKTTE